MCAVGSCMGPSVDLGEDGFGFTAIVVHLADEVLRAGKGNFRSEESDKLDGDELVIDVGIKVEDMDFKAGRMGAECRFDANRGNTGQRLLVWCILECDPGSIDTGTRLQESIKGEVGSGKTEGSAALFARDHRAGNRVMAAEQLGGGPDIAFPDGGADGS